MAEKWPLVRSQDCGGDEAAAAKLIEKHQVPCPERPPSTLDPGDGGR